MLCSVAGLNAQQQAPPRQFPENVQDNRASARMARLCSSLGQTLLGRDSYTGTVCVIVLIHFSHPWKGSAVRGRGGTVTEFAIALCGR